MTEDRPSTRARLVETAARLFRQNGYHGTGLARILTDTGVPKGSLYHHFPDGKADLALAAADWASQGMLRVVDDAFGRAASYEEGVTTLCHKLAKLFDISDHRDGCPVSTILYQDPDNPVFRHRAEEIFDQWIGRISDHAIRLDHDRDTATRNAEGLLMAIQGAWVLARARRSSDVIRQLPDRLIQGHRPPR